jgi:hypothetical protein
MSAIQSHHHMLLLSAGFKDGSPQNVSNLGSGAFKDKLLSGKRLCQHHHFEGKDHTQLILDYGTDKDDGFSSALISFLNDKLAPRAIESIPEKLKSTISSIVLPLVDPTGSDINKSPGFVVGIVSPKYSEVLGFGTKKIGESLTPDGDTFYGIGSVSKIFTGIMLAQEVVAKRMDPKKSLVTYLKDQSSQPCLRPLPLNKPSLTLQDYRLTLRMFLPLEMKTRMESEIAWSGPLPDITKERSFSHAFKVEDVGLILLRQEPFSIQISEFRWSASLSRTPWVLRILIGY